MVRLGELVMILDLHRQGLSVSDIARRSGFDRKTVRRYIARGLEPPSYTPRPPRPTLLDPYRAYLQERVAAYPELRASRLLRELRGLGYRGGYTQLTDFLREVRPAAAPRPASSYASRPRPGSKRRWISRTSAPSSPPNRA